MDFEKIPKYCYLKKQLINKINQEEFKLNELIPSERELIERYDVSRITVRKAIDDLVNQGYLYKVQGKGTYVKSDKYSQNLFSLTSCTQDITSFGMTPGRRVIDMGIETADKKRQRLLQIGNGEKVFFLERVYTADGEPINLTKTYIPYSLVSGIEKFDFSSNSLYETLWSEYGIALTKAVRTIEAAIADEDVSNLLEVEPGIPIILFGCTTQGIVNGTEKPVETFKCHYRSDKFKFYINQVNVNEH